MTTILDLFAPDLFAGDGSRRLRACTGTSVAAVADRELRPVYAARPPVGVRAGSVMRAVSKKRAKENAQRRRLLASLREAQPWCARCGRSGIALDGHELLSRARGGSITDPGNIVLLCRRCHDDVTFRHHEIPDSDRWVR